MTLAEQFITERKIFKNVTPATPTGTTELQNQVVNAYFRWQHKRQPRATAVQLYLYELSFLVGAIAEACGSAVINEEQTSWPSRRRAR